MAPQVNKLSEYGYGFQIKSIFSLTHDKTFLSQICDILSSEYYESEAHQWLIDTILDYHREYNIPPTLDVFKIRIKQVKNEVLKVAITESLKEIYAIKQIEDLSFIETEFLNFCKNQQLKNALMSSVDLLSAGNYDDIRTLIDNALRSGQDRNIGHEYKKDIKTRYKKNSRRIIPTPWPTINTITKGGIGGGDLFLILGSPGGGKSWACIEAASFAAQAGFKVIYYTGELGEDYVGKRFDANLTNIGVSEIEDHQEEVEEALNNLKGELIVKEFIAGEATLSTIESHYKKCVSQGFEADLIIIDYLDLLKSKRKRENKLDETNDIYLAGRGLARKLKIPIWSPCQLNRAGANDDVVEGDKVGGSYGKLQIADFAMSQSRKRKDKLNGTCRWHIIKNRYGPDGMTYNSTIDTSTGHIVMDENEMGEIPDGNSNNSFTSNTISTIDKKSLADKFFSLENKGV